MDGLADVHRVGAHLDGQGDLADHVAGVRADDAAAQDAAVAVRLGAVVEQQLGKAFVAPVGDGAAAGRPGEAVRDPSGREIARGLANYASAEARLLCRKPSSEVEKLLGYVAESEMVHRDNLVLTAG
ncbi:gamma-glutamyl kinase [Sphingobium sp. TKS]|nr:gamma-glutamyl kinase [Sphingobium sp. TKS]